MNERPAEEHVTRSKVIKPRVLSGFRDFLPAQMLRRQHVLGILRDVFEQHGFEPLDTPALEHLETLTGQYGEDEKLLYRFEDHGGRLVGLRYDLTVPLARVAAQHANELVLPFKRYQIAPVWRGDRPQRGRFREFFQCDVDTIGSPSMLADAEAIATVSDALGRLGFRSFRIHLNHRRLVAGLARMAGIDSTEAGMVYRAIDKIEKIGLTGVREELLARGLGAAAVDRAMDLFGMDADDATALAALRAQAVAFPDVLEALEELERLMRFVAALGVPPDRFGIRLSMVRGLHYYTGPVFEVTVEQPRVGSVSGGGRYDGLIGTFSGRDVPATGFSIGLERVLEVIEEFDLLPSPRRVVDVLVAIVRDRGSHGREDERGVSTALETVATLRAAGIRADIYVNERRALRDQFAYAARKGIPLIVVAGEDELATDTVVLRDLRRGDEEAVPRRDLARRVRNALALGEEN